jgi:RNA polymerase sigma factor (sigma-70 family)
MSGNVERRKGLSWEPLEPLFQLLLPVFFGERKPQSADEDEALTRIRLALGATASGIFRSPRFRGLNCDPQVAAQVFFVAIRAVKNSYDRNRPFHKLAYVILSHVCCDQGRAARVRRTVGIPPGAISRSAPPPVWAIRREQRQRVRRALRTLKLNGKMSRAQRTAIALKYYRGLSSKEAGERCGVSAATIDMRLYQARLLLRKQLCKGA